MTLLLRLVGPMQSWGSRSRFLSRDTNLEPTKSGVLGLIAAALGRSRWSVVEDLAALKFGVRADREGQFSTDYQTVLNAHHADGSAPKLGHQATITHRHYLADAGFLAGVEGDPRLLEEIQAALQNPHWHLALGRRSYTPSLPIHLPDGLVAQDLEAALETYPLVAPPRRGTTRLRLVIEDPNGSEIREDQPIDDYMRRSMGRRLVRTTYLDLATLPAAGEGRQALSQAELWPSQRPRRAWRHA